MKEQEPTGQEKKKEQEHETRSNTSKASVRPPSNAHILTISGKRISLHERIPAGSIDIVDIAHGLSLQNRFNGHTKHPYSVAQHCLNCLGCATEFHVELDPNVLLAILLHDCAEAYLGDIVRPLKYLYQDALEAAQRSMRPSSYKAYDLCTNAMELENCIESAIYNHFRVPHFDPRAEMLIKEIDTRLCATESMVLCAESMPEGVETYPIYEKAFANYDFRFVKERFLKNFYDLVQARENLKTTV